MKKYIKCIGIIIFIYICAITDWAQIMVILKKLNVTIFLSALFFTFLIVGIKAYRFKTIVNEPLFTLYEANTLFFIGIFWGVITPGKVGELFKVTYLGKYGLNKINSFIAVIVDRMYDVFTLGIISIWGLIYFSNPLNAQYSVYILLGAFIACYIFMFSKIGEKIIEKILKKISADLSEKETRKFFEILKNNFIKSVVLSFVCWILFYLQLYVIAVSLNLDLAYIQICAVMSILSVVMLIPITAFGVGTRDVSLIAMFSLIGLSKEKAVTFSIMHLLLYFLNAFLGLFFYLSKRGEQ